MHFDAASVDMSQIRFKMIYQKISVLKSFVYFYLPTDLGHSLNSYNL